MKKILKLCVCSLTAVMLAAGCGSKAENGASTAAQTTGSEAETTGGAAQTSASSDVEAGTVNTGTKETSVTLGEYKGIAFTPVSAEVTDEEVDNEIQNLLDMNPVLTEVERAAKDGDVVNIDYVGKKDGVAFQGGTDSGFDLTLGSGSFIDGFEDGLIGAKAGEKRKLNLTFPENYRSTELAGQAVVFEVTVNAVKEPNPAELNDAFIAENTTSKTVEEYRSFLRKEMETQAAEEAETQERTEIFQKVMENCQVAVADSEVQPYYEEQFNMYKQRAESMGTDLATLAGYYGLGLEGFKMALQESAIEALKQQEVARAIAEKENITVAEEDRVQLAEETGYESVESMLALETQEDVDNYILREKVVDFLCKNAVEDKSAKPDQAG